MEYTAAHSREVAAVQRSVNSLSIKRGQGSAKLVLQELENQREAARVKYEQVSVFQQEYEARDSEELPGFLFCADAIQEAEYYKDNLAALVTIKDDDDQSAITDRRKRLLQSAPDKGKAYYDLNARLMKQTRLHALNHEKNTLVQSLDNALATSLPPSLLGLIEQSKECLHAYKSASIKSKKVKEKFNVVVNNLTLVYYNTNVPVHRYYSIVYDVNVIVNTLDDKTSSVQKCSGLDLALLKAVRLQFINNLDALEKTVSIIKQESKFIINTISNVKQTAYEKIRSVQKELSIPHSCQTGKHFKKWSALTPEQKLERLDSFAKWYVSRKFVHTQLIEISDFEKYATSLSDALAKSISSGKLQYKDIKWNVSSGVISSIHGVLFDEDTTSFSLQLSPSKKSKRRPSTKTIVTKSNDKYINDVALQCVLKNEKKDQFITLVKEKLKVHKLTAADKEALAQRFAEISELVQQESP